MGQSELALPPLGEVPETMTAMAIRSERMGTVRDAFQPEELPVPRPGPRDVLIAVMAAGVNYNNVWAALGHPIDVIARRQRAGEPHDFHIGGSDAAGIVWATGDDVDTVSVGDEVVIHPGVWDPHDPWISDGGDPMIAPSAKIWGYDTNFGAFAQFALVAEHQCLPKAPHLTWEEAAAPTLVGTTAYRMLLGWPECKVEPDDLVLVWGGSGGLGSQAIQLVKASGGRVVAVVSSQERGKYCEDLGADGWVDRREFDHWGPLPEPEDAAGYRSWIGGAKSFQKAVKSAAGTSKDPKIVFEHPGAATIPTSVLVCAPGGMVVICAATTGFKATLDLRYQWTQQKRLQGSHGTNHKQAIAYNDLVRAGSISPCLADTLRFDQIPQAHHQMAEGEDILGNLSILINAEEPGLGRDPNWNEEKIAGDRA